MCKRRNGRTWQQRFKSTSQLNTAAFALLGELYSRVSGQHLSSRLLCPEAAETEPPDQLQFPKGQEGWPVDRRTDRWTHVDLEEAPLLITFRPNKVEHERIFPPPGGKNSWATANILFFSIIKEFKVKQLSGLIHYPSSLKLRQHLILHVRIFYRQTLWFQEFDQKWWLSSVSLLKVLDACKVSKRSHWRSKTFLVIWWHLNNCRT